VSRRPATITQADITRTGKALRACGLSVVRVVTNGSTVTFETSDGSEHTVAGAGPTEPKREIVL
jgi:hypothetical protein